MTNQTHISYLSPWKSQVDRGWLKAILVIIIYFLARVQLETFVLHQGIVNSGMSESDLLAPGSVMIAFSNSQAGYFLKDLLLLVGVLFLLWVLKLDMFNFKKVDYRGIRNTMIFFVLMYFVQVIFNLLITIFLPDYGGPANQQAVEQLSVQIHPMIMFFSVVIVAPIIEEVLFRGLIMKHIFWKWPIIGFIASSVIFTWLHSPANWVDFLSYYILSAGITYVYWRTRRIEFAIQFHMTQNLIAFIGLQLI